MIVDDLRSMLEGAKSSPFLFAGSGLGRRYIGLETWEDLLRLFAAKTPRPYEYYVTLAGENLPRVGTRIAQAFADVWWDSTEYEASRDNWKHLIKDFSTPLKLEIARHIKEKTAALITGDFPAELTLLAQARIDGVITTNYDTLLEAVFPDYTPYRSQDEAVLSVSHGVGEIYKIHGCLTEPASMVLTEEDYQRFEERDAYLAAKLTTLFIEHPVIFVGYSISDTNVRRVLQAVLRCMPDRWVPKLHDHLFFVEYERGAGTGAIQSHSLSFDGTVLPLTRIIADDFSQVFGAITKLEQKIPASVLRRVKERVYELVLTTDPKGSLAVVNIDDTDSLSNVDVVVGVGLVKALSAKGYDVISRDDLVDDVLNGRGEFDAEQLIKHTLPRLRRQQPKSWFPVWGYIAKAELPESEIPKEVKEAALSTLDEFRSGSPYKNSDVSAYDGIDDLTSKEPLSRAAYLILNLPEEKLSAPELRMFLTNTKTQYSAQNAGVRSAWVKLVCLLDYLEHRQPGEVPEP